jgi:hypothetical protein
VDAIEATIHERPVVVTNHYAEYSQLDYRFEPLGQAFLVRTTPNFDPPADLTSIDISLGNQVTLLGYRLEVGREPEDETEPTRPLVLTLVWSPTAEPETDIALFAQLIGADGRLWSVSLDSRHPPSRLVAGEVIVERFAIYPLLHTPPGDYTLTVGAYSPAGRLIANDGSDAVQVTTVHVRPTTLQPVTAHPIYARFAGGPTLVGVDYDTGISSQVRVYLHWAGSGDEADVHLLDEGGAVVGQGHIPALTRGQYATLAFDLPAAPARVLLLDGDQPRRQHLFFGQSVPLPSPTADERYVPFGDSLALTDLDGPTDDLHPGQSVTLGLHFLATRPLARDYVISTALAGINADTTWAWRVDDDGVPAMGAIPTLKWIHRSAIFDPHQLTIPNDAPQLPAEGSLVIYDHFTQSPLPPLDERLHLGPIVPLGTWAVTTP